MSWQAPGPVWYYLVQWKADGQRYSPWERGAVTEDDVTSYRITGLAPATRYTVRVPADDDPKLSATARGRTNP